ncbi:VWA domain-containing protein [Saxibacter everestensis]|uniref:VWA domain-containing protein n=1 Tax=Saxibacter everestensis TaxID=2909229 RepID=A0ABY8QSY1_9MICO|nr:VWA domain-containing protein [Brevibacteriaceae bacterium ZFBP1038]
MPTPAFRRSVRPTARRRQATALLLTLLAGAVFSAIGLATPSSAATTSVPTMVVLDASGSMKAADSSGTRMDAAKDATKSLIDSVPADARLGLSAYGTSTSSADSAKAAGCKDVKTLAKVGPVDKARLKKTVEGIKASGYTPVGAALKAAAAELPTSGARSIVLVSDGIDTCAPPDACDVAKDLKEKGFDLNVHVVGFKVKGGARKQLNCIAEATGGSYADAGDTRTLTEKLQTQTKRGIEGYKPTGTPVEGTEDPAEAPLIEPGQYTDVLREAPEGDRQGSELHYKIRLDGSERINVAATSLLPTAKSGSNDYFGAKIELMDSEGASCTTRNNNDLQVGTGAEALPTTINYSAVDPADEKYCNRESGEFTILVARLGDLKDVQVPIELIVGTEPIPAKADGKPAASSPEKFVAPAARSGAAPRDVKGGDSFNTAPVLTPGTFTDRIAVGERRFYSVPVTYGQRLSVSATPGGETKGSPTAKVDIANPLRQKLRLSEDSSYVASLNSGDYSVVSASTIVPVRYRNTESPDEDIQQYYLDGNYYFVVQIEDEDGDPNKGVEVPYTLNIDTPGEIETGATYEKTEATPGDDGRKVDPLAAVTTALTSPWVWGPALGVLVLAIGAAILIPLLLRRRRRG